MPNPKHSGGFRLGIVNPLTLAGNEIRNILRERAFPLDKLVLLDSSGKSAGVLTDIDDEPAYVINISDDELEELDLVFFCGEAEANREWLERAADRFLAIDLSQPSTADRGRLAVAGINLESLGDTDDLVFVSPHPVAIPIALMLHQIEQASRVSLCAATVIQPASTQEQAGVEELAAQTVTVLNVQTIPTKVFGRQLAFNLYPAPEHHEEFITSQVRKLINPKTGLAVLVTQGTIFHGHTFSLFVQTDEPLPTEEVTRLLKENTALSFAEGDQEFGTIDAAGKDEVLIAEVRADPAIPGAFWVWAVCDNLRRGSALNAVLVSEKVLFGTRVN